VIEWIAAIWLIWTYGEVTRNRAWWALSLAMLPALVSYVCLHLALFDNPESLEWLVTLQATMTLVGNFTLAAAWWIWRSTQSADGEQPSKEAINPVSKPRLRQGNDF